MADAAQYQSARANAQPEHNRNGEPVTSCIDTRRLKRMRLTMRSLAAAAAGGASV